MSFKRYLVFIVLNIIISAAVVLAVLSIWDRMHQGDTLVPETEEMPVSTELAPQPTYGAEATTSPPSDDEPAADTLTYKVQPGDTLGAIGLKFNIPWEEIARLNLLSDPNDLDVGMELLIPLGEVPTPLPTPIPTATSAEIPTPISTESPGTGEAKLEIIQVTGAGDLRAETVIIANMGTRGIQLSQWTLRDGKGNAYVFQPIFLYGNGANIGIHTRPGTDTPSDLYWGLSQAAWKSGDTVFLYDPDGTVRATFDIP